MNPTFVGRYIESDAQTVKQHLNKAGINVLTRQLQPGVVELYVGESRINEASDIVSNITDYDMDGVSDSKDCNPFNPTQQDFGSSTPKETLHEGYPVEDYYYTSEGYKLQPGAQQDPRWLKEQTKTQKKERKKQTRMMR